MKLTNIASLREGGNALKSANVQRITREDIPETIRYVSKISGIPVNDLTPLGSVGKQPTSGDIDLAVDINSYDAEDVHAKMVPAIGADRSVINRGTKINSYAVPIRGDEQNGLVQVDLMFTKNVNWSNFAYHSPGEQSKYKGVVRGLLLSNTAATYEQPGEDHFEFDPVSGELIVRAGRTLDLSTGMRRIFQFRPKKKSGEGYLSRMKSISLEEFKNMFPDVEIQGTDVIIDDPKKVTAILFGSDVRPKDVSTAEQVIRLIKQRFSESRQQTIFRNVARNLGNTVKLPPEIEEYVK